MKIFIYSGFTISLLSLLIAAFYYSLYMMGKIKVPGYASLIFSIWFTCGVLLSSLGIIGVYVGRTFDQVKGRPKFIVSDAVNMDET